MRKSVMSLLAFVILASCVSKKKYVALEQENGEIKSQLTKTRVEKEELEAKFDAIQQRVDAYNTKIAALSEDVNSLTQDNESKLTLSSDGTPISNDMRRQMEATLTQVDPSKLSQARTLKDSMSLAVAHNLERFVDRSDLNEDDDVAINVNETVVMISISDKMLFNSGSYRVSSKADNILEKLANVINSEPSLDVMVEGHTDPRTINTATVKDNWDLSVLRATSVVRRLQNKFNVTPEQLIASGRSSFQPITENETREGRSRNRRTRIILMPNIDKFFALMSSAGN